MFLKLGDCLDFLPTLGEGSIDLVWTDPPYGHGNNDGDLIHNWEKALGHPVTASSAARPIAIEGAEANEILLQCLPEWRRILKPGACCCCCCCGGGGPDPQFARWSLWMDEVLEFKQMVVWDKGPMGLGWHFRRSYETVLVAMKPGAKCKWYDETHRVENIIRPGQYGIRKIIPSKEQHPTQKPVELAMHFIGLHTQVGDTVCDPFMGAGGTGVAAVRMGRNFIGCEIDPYWFEVAKKRIELEASQLRMEV